MAKNDDITTNVEATEEDIKNLKKEQYATNPSTHLAKPQQVAETPQGLNPDLVRMTQLGKYTNMFSGIERCIRIIDPGTPSQHHCLSMIVSNLTTNEKMCTRCTRTHNAGDPRPKIINSSMIRLSDKELAECGLDHDPLLNAKPTVDPLAKPVKISRKKVEAQVAKMYTRRPKVATPKTVKIEMSMEDLKSDPSVLNAILKKTLDAIYELPVSNFREAEEIRVVKERVESYLTQGEKSE